jgi:hypothetical protein
MKNYITNNTTGKISARIIKYKFEVAFPDQGQGDGLRLWKWNSQPEDRSQGDLYIIVQEDGKICHGHAFRKGGKWTTYGTSHPDDVLGDL